MCPEYSSELNSRSDKGQLAPERVEEEYFGNFFDPLFV